MSEEYNGAAVYKMTFPDGSIYVGACTHFKTRKQTHLSDMRNGKHTAKIQNKYNVFGFPEFEILEKVPKYETRLFLFSREHFWMDQLSPKLNATRDHKGDPLEWIAECCRLVDVYTARLAQTTDEKRKKYYEEKIDGYDEYITRFTNYYFSRLSEND